MALHRDHHYPPMHLPSVVRLRTTYPYSTSVSFKRTPTKPALSRPTRSPPRCPRSCANNINIPIQGSLTNPGLVCFYPTTYPLLLCPIIFAPPLLVRALEYYPPYTICALYLNVMNTKHSAPSALHEPFMIFLTSSSSALHGSLSVSRPPIKSVKA